MDTVHAYGTRCRWRTILHYVLLIVGNKSFFFIILYEGRNMNQWLLHKSEVHFTVKDTDRLSKRLFFKCFFMCIRSILNWYLKKECVLLCSHINDLFNHMEPLKEVLGIGWLDIHILLLDFTHLLFASFLLSPLHPSCIQAIVHIRGISWKKIPSATCVH